MRKLKFLPFLALSFLGGNAFAGTYNLCGYINEVKTNIQGEECDIGLSYNFGGNIVQHGTWSCNNNIGTNLLDIAKMARALKLYTQVTFEGNGATYKPVYSIRILSNNVCTR